MQDLHPPAAPHDTADRLTVACLGDVCFTPAVRAAAARAGPDAARALWRPVGHADLTVYNLEHPLCSGTSPAAHQWRPLHAPADLAGLLPPGSVAGLANNHAMDHGERGLEDTLAALSGRGIETTGAGRDLAAAGRPVLRTIRGIRIGILCAADPRFCAAGEDRAGVFPARIQSLSARLGELRGAADVRLVFLHAGVEFAALPSRSQLALADACLDAGAHVVAYHHSHVLGGIRRDARGALLSGLGSYVFAVRDFGAAGRPRMVRRAVRRSAAWRVVIGPDGTILDVAGEPLLLSGDGWPQSAPGDVARAIRRRIRRSSQAIASPGGLGWRRAWAMLNPAFLLPNLAAYADLAARRGWRSAMCALREGWKTHGGCPTGEGRP